MTKQENRKSNTPIKVYCLTAEKDEIESRAGICGMSASMFLRTIGQGYRPPSILENKKIRELLQVNADLGRLGGLLKLWLSNDRKSAHFNKEDIVKTLNGIGDSQDELRSIIKQVLKV